MSVVSLAPSKGNPIGAADLDHVLSLLGVTLDEHEKADYTVLLAGLQSSVEIVSALPDYGAPTSDSSAARNGAQTYEERFPRLDVHLPTDGNELGAWAWKCKINDTQPNQGPLSGRTVVVKDNVCVAGVPCLLGTSVFDDWTPQIDATAVKRMLEAGATLVGKGVCENLSMSASSFSAATGPVHNPYARGYNTGGSSSGVAALVVSGAADLALGCDQGGSIRLPSSWCGLVGLKPTWGLVSYAGIVPLEPVLDHTGPMTHNVADNALMLDVLAGRDDLDHRTLGTSPAKELPRYTEALVSSKGVGKSASLKGVKIGLLKEGFANTRAGGLADARVGDAVLSAAKCFEELGATVEEISVPWHSSHAPHLWVTVARMGCVPGLASSMGGRGGASGSRGLALPDYSRKCRGMLGADPWAKMPWAPKNMALNGTFLWEKHPDLYGKALNQISHLRSMYDAALDSCDVLVMPTTPFLANTHASPEDSVLTKISRSLGQTVNTCPFNATGHPALNLPVGFLPTRETPEIKLPVGMQIVAKHFEEGKIYQVASGWEAGYDWKKEMYT